MRRSGPRESISLLLVFSRNSTLSLEHPRPASIRAAFAAYNKCVKCIITETRNAEAFAEPRSGVRIEGLL
uniref:Putative secreted peptide n=1 Tax=Anopheles braziliensis TaxID=58242 RepID=A0A2M3ZUZ0_9DIPT